MPLKDVDFLSQEISLFYYGRTRHSGNFGGILTILMILCCLLYIFYIVYEVFLHTTSTIQYYRHYFKNPGNFSFNNTQGIFHYFQIYDPIDNEVFPFDSKYIRLFMTNIHEQYKVNPELLLENDHWVYDECREGIENGNLTEDIFQDVSFKDGLCIRYYYNSTSKKYYSIDDSQNFIYPSLINLGTRMGDSIGTIVEKCKNDSVLTTIFGPCADDDNITDYFKTTYGINFNVLTHEIRPGVYEETTYHYIYEISNLMRKKHILENNLIFSPLITNFNLGLFYPKNKENTIYTFSDNYEEIIDKKESNNVLCVYKFYLAKYGYIYKATYQTIYESLYKIGGIFQLIYYIFFGINYIFNKFTIINDTKKLFFTLHNDEKINGGDQIKKFSKIVTRLRNEQMVNDTSTEIIRNISNLDNRGKNLGSKYKHRSTKNFQESLFFQKNSDSKNLSVFPFISDKDINVLNNNKYSVNNDSDFNNGQKEEIIINNKKDKKLKMLSKFSNENEKLNKKNENNSNNIDKKEKSEIKEIKKLLQNSKGKNNFRYSIPNHDIVDKEILNFKVLLKRYIDYKKKFFVYEKMTVDKINHFFNMSNFLISCLCYKKPKRYFNTLQNFRKKLLSEEHFFKTQNNLYLIEKCFDLRESKIIDIVELYKNL